MAPGAINKLAPSHSSCNSFRSKFTVLKKVFVTLFGLFGAPRSDLAIHSDLTHGELCPPCYVPGWNINKNKNLIKSSCDLSLIFLHRLYYSSPHAVVLTLSSYGGPAALAAEANAAFDAANSEFFATYDAACAVANRHHMRSHAPRLGLSESLQDISDTRKTAVINNELKRLNVDIAALQETRLADSSTLKEKDFTYYWQGKTSDERREHGVGFAVKKSLQDFPASSTA